MRVQPILAGILLAAGLSLTPGPGPTPADRPDSTPACIDVTDDAGTGLYACNGICNGSCGQQNA
jgi:hypothetical protein